MATRPDKFASVVKHSSCCMMCQLQLASALPQIMGVIGTTDDPTVVATKTITTTTASHVMAKVHAPVGYVPFVWCH